MPNAAGTAYLKCFSFAALPSFNWVRVILQKGAFCQSDDEYRGRKRFTATWHFQPVEGLV
jgi:hypothetical protein